MSKILSVRNFPKAIFHMDGDAFFAGVEVAKNPKLRGKPVVVGAERGIVTAATYEAKALGVSRGVPIFQIKKNFPQVIILAGDYESYADYSQRMFDIVRRYTDAVEEYSIDECFADLTGWRRPLKMTYEEILQRIKREVEEELDLSVSLGLAPTKVLAKVASKWKKPRGLTIIPGNRAHEFLAKTPISAVWGIGPSTSHFLMRKGIKTAYDFATKGENWIKHFLTKPNFEIWQELNCRSVFNVDAKPKTEYSSIQKTRTFHPPSSDETFLLSALSKNLEAACKKARFYRLGARVISFFLKTQEFRYHTHSFEMLSPTNLPEIIMPLIRKEFPKIFKEKFLYRTTGVILRELESLDKIQLDLFGSAEKMQKFETIHQQIDSLEKMVGVGSIFLASTQKVLKRKKLGTDIIKDDRNLLFL